MFTFNNKWFKGACVAAFLLGCQVGGYAQAQKTASSTETELRWGITPAQETAKKLYEEHFGVKLTIQEFGEKISRKPQNLETWKTVYNHFKGNPNVDMSYVEGLIQGLTIKLGQE